MRRAHERLGSASRAVAEASAPPRRTTRQQLERRPRMGLFPLYFAAAGLSVARIGILAAIYPAIWVSASPSPADSRTVPAARSSSSAGMLTQGAAIAWIVATTSFAAWALGAALLGVGAAMVYPTLLAAIGDIAHPNWRARSIGIYRVWRDGGFAVGAILASVIADAGGISAAIWAAAPRSPPPPASPLRFACTRHTRPVHQEQDVEPPPTQRTMLLPAETRTPRKEASTPVARERTQHRQTDVRRVSVNDLISLRSGSCGSRRRSWPVQACRSRR